jgi:hypothetical protein
MKMLLAACALSIVASAGAEAPPSKSYVGLYADAARASQSAAPSLWGQFVVWIWWLPSERGFIAASFRIPAQESKYARLALINNPSMPIIMDCGFGDDAMCAVFNECQGDWVWSQQIAYLLMDAQPGVVEIVPPSGESAILAVTCEPGNPTEPVAVFNQFGVNRDAVIAVEPQSWGAIKGMYR